MSSQPKNTDTTQPSPETDKEKERGQACPGPKGRSDAEVRQKKSRDSQKCRNQGIM